jgi:hypothetical protein
MAGKGVTEAHRWLVFKPPEIEGLALQMVGQDVETTCLVR